MCEITNDELIPRSSLSELHENLSTEELIQRCITQDNCKIASNGAVVAYSGKYTGRTPKDKHIVREPSSDANIWWENNNALTEAEFDELVRLGREYAQGKTLYQVDTFGGANPKHRIAARFLVERPYHALFIKQLLIRPSATELSVYQPDWTIVDLCHLSLTPGKDPGNGDAMIALNFGTKQVLLLGTQYAGEMKKSVFTILNYLLPLQGVLSMHCSANVGKTGDTALFFGLSGTGKTTLSADSERFLIGDDEHGWSDDGVFNIEGGCYAKCVGLKQDREPQIWDAIKQGSVLENVPLSSDGTPDYEDITLTENTRAAYPINYISGALEPSVGGHPKNIVFLTCDAKGVLPPISKLTSAQAQYHFLNGYTAKVAGTETGITEPVIAFSTCFGAPFLPLRPKVYADLLAKKIDAHGSKVWLINTGWTGGGNGVGSRIKLAYTRAMIHAAFDGKLDEVVFVTESIFGLQVPVSCPGVPSEILQPQLTWADPHGYETEAADLKSRFEKNFALYK